MGKKMLLWVLLLGVVIMGGVIWGEKETPVPDKEKKPSDKETVIAGNNEFALELYAKLRENKGNLFFSPYSISTALAMTYGGARENTAKQMAEVMRFTLEQKKLHPAFAELIKDLNAEKKGYQLSVANALWGQEGYNFLADFIELTKNNYGAGLNEVDFANATEDARQTINAWVEKQTQDKIKELLKPGIINELTRLVLTNAIYFKGNWAVQFKKEKTKDALFTLPDGKKIDVPMMNQTGNFKYGEGEGLKILEMPYVDGELSMVILLPEKDDGITDLEESLNTKNLKQWLQGIVKQEVIVALPKFKTTSEFLLNKVLESMGMTDAFSGKEADFSGLNGTKHDLYITAVVHKAFVDVNEEGTEAAAATAVIIGTKSARQTTTFRADHPFIFFIRDTRSGGILFMGRVEKPGGETKEK